MKQKILIIPDENEALRKKSHDVKTFDKNLDKLVTNLADSLEAQKDPPGLGLSAPQIGVLKRVFVARVKNRIRGFVNPHIVKMSKKEVTILEGCLSVPELYGHVIRPAELDLMSQNKQGRKTTAHYKGLVARVIQHEVDHLDGILFIDHVHHQNGKMFKTKKNKDGKEIFIEVKNA